MLIHLGDGGLCRLRHKVVFIKKWLAIISAFLISINLDSTESFVIVTSAILRVRMNPHK